MLVDVLAAIAALLSGLGAGIFLAYSTGIIQGLSRAGDDAFVAGMRGINVAVINPVFLGAIFLGPLVAAAGAIAGFVVGSDAAWWLLASAIVGLVAVWIVTGAHNVPMNNALETSRDGAAAARAAFERPWLFWNHIRALGSMLAFGLAIVALLAD